MALPSDLAPKGFYFNPFIGNRTFSFFNGSAFKITIPHTDDPG